MKTITLTMGQEVIVDDEWYPILNEWNWYFHNGYAARDIGGRNNKQHIYMHRYICMAPDGYEVDHINQNKLDNRKENLRVVLPEKNYYNRAKQINNTTGYKGVCYDRKRNKYMATISYKRKQMNLGRFKTAKEAAKAYNEAAIKLHGDYSCLNQI